MAQLESVTAAEFEAKVLKADLPVVVDFWAPWCGPCLRLAPVLEEVAQELSGRAKVVKVNTDENPDIPSRYGIMSIPTLVVFKNGEEVGRIVGALPKVDLKQKLEAALA